MYTKSRQHRDLQWILKSPPLVTNGAPKFVWPNDTWFSDLPSLPRSLNLPTPKHTHHFRLGHDFERLIEYRLTHQRCFDLVSANLQVQSDRRTVGEFDFLIKHNRKIEHWEAAIKFYLAFGDQENPYRWFGPNPSDSLGKKYGHLINHQLSLSAYPDSKDLLCDMNLRVEKILCFMKGRLFYPIEKFNNGDFIHPSIINPTHEKGWWLKINDFDSIFDKRCSYTVLEKAYWLSPLRNDLKGESFETVSEKLINEKAQLATLVVVLDHDNNEISRGFVVSEKWLDLTNQKTSVLQ